MCIAVQTANGVYEWMLSLSEMHVRSLDLRRQPPCIHQSSNRVHARWLDSALWASTFPWVPQALKAIDDSVCEVSKQHPTVWTLKCTFRAVQVTKSPCNRDARRAVRMHM